MAIIQQHHIKALTPTWFLAKITPPAAPVTREGPNKKAIAAHSPLLLLPAAWQEPQDEKRPSKDGGGMPASPRISCMGHVKGKSRGCISARGPAPPTKGHRGAGGGTGGSKAFATLVLGLFGRRNARTSRACAKVRDVPGSSRGGRHGGAPATVLVLDPPLPVVRRPATDANAPNLWERRRGGKAALQGLQLTQIAPGRASIS